MSSRLTLYELTLTLATFDGGAGETVKSKFGAEQHNAFRPKKRNLIRKKAKHI
jgi:hypothetical protein